MRVAWKWGRVLKSPTKFLIAKESQGEADWLLDTHNGHETSSDRGGSDEASGSRMRPDSGATCMNRQQKIGWKWASQQMSVGIDLD